MTPLDHTDHILKARKGEYLLASEPVKGVDMNRGGTIDYSFGSRFRVKSSFGDFLWVLDEKGQSVTFIREDLTALSRCTAPTANLTNGR